MAQYLHALYFEARDLTERERERVRRHFLKRRDSGGGECGPLEKLENNIYRISFQETADQERVLQRKFHTINLPGGELQLVVARSSSTSGEPCTGFQQKIPKANTKNLEKLFPLETFLLYYLRDKPKAFKILQKQLSAIGCTVDLDFEEEQAVVRGDVEKDTGSAFAAAEKWELQVDKIFINFTEYYVCHHVLEPKQVKVLLQQDPSFENDDIKVYTESGYAVIVGEAQVVKERCEILEKNVPIQKELPIVEKVQLVEEEFIREMRVHYPQVKVNRGSGVITLVGLDKDVQAGAAKLDEMVKNIKEKRVPLATALMNFITSSGVILKYQDRFKQSLRSPVSIEVGSDLVLSSLSSSALDEAQEALSKDLKIATVELKDAAAVPPDLDRVKQTLTKAKDQENRQDLKVDVSFIPTLSGTAETKVQLVGYTESVQKLKEILQDYQMNQVATQDTIPLSDAQLVDCFDEILKLIGMKTTNVTLKALHFPTPCILVSGARCKVQETRQALTSVLASLSTDTLVLDGPGAQCYFQGNGRMSKDLVESSFQVIIREQQGVQVASGIPKPRSSSSSSSSISSISSSLLSNIAASLPISRGHILSLGSSAASKVNLLIKIGSLEDEQVKAFVAPMIKKQLNATYIGASLLKKAGIALQTNFDSQAMNRSFAPGDVLQVDGPPSLGRSKVFFIECIPWDGVRGTSVQALRNGLRRCLDLCAQQGFTSLALPVIGPGKMLKYPLGEAIQVLNDTMCAFGSSASSGSLSNINIVIKPGYPDSEECYRDISRQLSSNRNQAGQAIFTSVIGDLDDTSITLRGGVELKIVFGDITNETTDAVVNTTDFVNLHYDGVCKDILTIAGPAVEAELKAAGVGRGGIFQSSSGQFPCKALLHVCGLRDAGLIETLASSIIDYCERNNFKSVAFPAICAGIGGLEPNVVAEAILQGLKTATTSVCLNKVSEIRIVVDKIKVFLAFEEKLMQIFTSATLIKGSAAQLVPTAGSSVQQVQPVPASADLSVLLTSAASQQSTFWFLGLCKTNVDNAKAKLRDLYENQCSVQTFKEEELQCLKQEDLESLKKLVDTGGMFVENDASGSLTVRGLKDDVNQVMKLINDSLQGGLKREIRAREEEELFTRVAWCIMENNGHWERLPQPANYILEKNLSGGIMDARGALLVVNRQSMEAQSLMSRLTRKLKRLENLTDFSLPLYWDNMAAGDKMKVVTLLHSSAEFKELKRAFKKTLRKSVIKIERLQNIHLRRAYEVLKKHISDNNARDGGAGEKLLYHGTTHDNCKSIMETGFDRRFAGQNATRFGLGTYFAMDASYSAHPTFSKPAADGSQLMFVARVLTGVSTQGSSDMNVPPPRDPQQPHNRYDSVVDKMDNPSMYVVFKDHQAYPDYLITFK